MVSNLLRKTKPALVATTSISPYVDGTITLHRDLPGVKNLACIKAANVFWLERHNPLGLAIASDELNLVCLTVAMHEDNRTNIANPEAMFRERSGQRDGIMFFDRHRNILPRVASELRWRTPNDHWI